VNVWERKIKQKMPFGRIPVYLRQLADALEKRTDDLPAELSDIPAPIVKMEFKAKPLDNGWGVKITIRAESPKDLETESGPLQVERDAPPPAKHDVNYTSLKKRMKSSFRSIGESLAAQKLPEPDIIDAFLEDSERMLAFPGEKYGAPCYPAYRDACRRLAEAFDANNREAFKAAYTGIGRLKKDCHAELK